MGMYLGLALVLYGAYMWFRNVVIEAEHQGHTSSSNSSPIWYDFIYSVEVMFFVWFGLTLI